MAPQIVKIVQVVRQEVQSTKKMSEYAAHLDIFIRQEDQAIAFFKRILGKQKIDGVKKTEGNNSESIVVRDLCNSENRLLIPLYNELAKPEEMSDRILKQLKIDEKQVLHDEDAILNSESAVRADGDLPNAEKNDTQRNLTTATKQKDELRDAVKIEKEIKANCEFARKVTHQIIDLNTQVFNVLKGRTEGIATEEHSIKIVREDYDKKKDLINRLRLTLNIIAKYEDNVERDLEGAEAAAEQIARSTA
jgi:hypothetical protein